MWGESVRKELSRPLLRGALAEFPLREDAEECLRRGGVSARLLAGESSLEDRVAD